MYKRIYIPVDNSEHSDAAVELAVALGKAFGSTLVGSHVYAARMHDSLITMGLQLISDSYLEVLAQKAAAAGLPCTKVMMDGKNYAELVRDIQRSAYDLVVIGALGMGAVKHSG